MHVLEFEVCYNFKTNKAKNFKLLHTFVDKYVYNRKDNFYSYFFGCFYYLFGMELS